MNYKPSKQVSSEVTDSFKPETEGINGKLKSIQDVIKVLHNIL